MNRLKTVRKFIANPSLNRAGLARLLGFSYIYTCQLADRVFETDHSSGEILVNLKSVERYFESRAQRDAARSAGQLKLPLSVPKPRVQPKATSSKNRKAILLPKLDRSPQIKIAS